jgi:hypothetical protein
MILKSMLTDEAMYSPRAQVTNQIIALGLIVLFVTALKIKGCPGCSVLGQPEVRSLLLPMSGC